MTSFFSVKNLVSNAACESKEKNSAIYLFFCFCIKHIYLSFSINRYVQIQITSALSPQTKNNNKKYMDNYFKIYKLTKNMLCFFVLFFNTTMYLVII